MSNQYRRERWTRKETQLVLACGIANLLNWVFLFASFRLISVTISILLDVGLTGFRPDGAQTAGIALLFGCLFAALFAPASRKPHGPKKLDQAGGSFASYR